MGWGSGHGLKSSGVSLTGFSIHITQTIEGPGHCLIFENTQQKVLGAWLFWRGVLTPSLAHPETWQAAGAHALQYRNSLASRATPAHVGGMRKRLPSRLAISTQSDEQTGQTALRLVMIQISMPLCPMSPLEDESGVSLRFHL